MRLKRSHVSLNLLLREGHEKALSEALNEMLPFELADLISKKGEEDQLLIFKALSQSIALPTFEYLAPKTQQIILKRISKTQAAFLLKEMSPDDRTSFLQEIPREVVDELVKLLPYDERMMTLTLLGYPEGSIGRLMTPDYIAIGMDWTIEEVLDHIRTYGHNSETINYVYVINDNGVLLDDIKLKDLLFVAKQAKVMDISNKQFVTLSVYDNDETAINTFNQHDRTALPVIDEKGIMQGIVTIDDVLRLAHQVATEDIQKFGGMQVLDEPYMQAPFFELMRKRASWLVVLFLGEMLTATVMGYFEGEIAKAVVLALFLPLIISSGGNAGSQASTLVIRAMALGEVKLKDWWNIVKLELLSGIFLGVILGLIGFFRVTVWSLFSNIYGEHYVLIAVTIGLSLIGVVLCGTLSGAIFPLLLKRVGVDPATASAPFVATVVDVIGVVIYFLIAILILSGTLL